MDYELFIPGPVELTKGVCSAQARKVISHRGDGFHEVFKDSAGKLGKVFRTDSKVVVLTGSGTCAIDACLQSTILDGDRVLVFDNGDFGRRLGENAAIYARGVKVESVEHGRGISADYAKEKIGECGPTYVALVHNDTASGVENPLREIAKAANDAGAFVFADSVSALGGIKFEFDAWGIGASASSAQKCIAGPSGISFAALSAAAVERIEGQPKPRSAYLNLRTYLKFLEKDEHPTTPSISGFCGLRQALCELESEGLEKRIARHESMAKFVQTRAERIGFQLFAEDGYRSKTVTAIRTDKSKELRADMKAKGFVLSGGMAQYKDRILRIAHMGNITKERLSAMFEELEKSAEKTGT
jgi:aspartate aminotransferase-like enzyme